MRVAVFDTQVGVGMERRTMIIGLFSVCCLINYLTVISVAYYGGQGKLEEEEGCLAAYRRGGVPAVLESPECSPLTSSIHFNSDPNSNFNSDDNSNISLSPTLTHRNSTLYCQYGARQGPAKSQDEHMVCDTDIPVHFFAKNVSRKLRVGLVAVFDGPGSRMASKLLKDYFLVHIHFLYTQRVWHHNSSSSAGVLEDVQQRDILKLALLRTLDDIDFTLSKEAVRNNIALRCRSTVTVIIQGHILVANIGDSKALLCDVPRFRNYPTKTVDLSAEKIRKSLWLGRGDKKAQIKKHDHPSYSVELRSRSPFAPVVGDWQPLIFQIKVLSLVVASDGVFKSLPPEEVCRVLELDHRNRVWVPAFPRHKEGSFIVEVAYQLKDSAENLSAVVVPLNAAGFLDGIRRPTSCASKYLKLMAEKRISRDMLEIYLREGKLESNSCR